MRPHHSLLAALAVFIAAGCDRPLPTEAGDDAAVASAETGLQANSAGMTATQITGTIALAGGEDPGRVVITPSGVCHFFQMPTLWHFAGDVAGFVIFQEDIHDMWCDGSKLVLTGSLEGEFTWNGRTGPVEGHFKVDCRGDGTPPPTCVTKLMNAHGSGDLKGVLFQFDVAPGWIPFDYSGQALSR